jgi:hypothetical protein
MASTSDFPSAPNSPTQPSQSFGDRAKEEVSSAREHVRGAGQSLREEAKGLGTAVRNKLADSMESGKETLADSLNDFTAAIRKAGDELDGRDQRSVAGLVHSAADGLDEAIETVRTRSVEDLGQSIASFARQQPAAFIIGALIAGVALGRFVRASGPQQEAADYGDPYDY